MSLLRGAKRVYLLLARAGDLIGAATMFAMMVIVAMDVACRYFFNSPISWSFDLISWYLMPASFFFFLSSTLIHRHHINISLLVSALKPSTRRVLASTGAVLSAILFFAIAYLGARRAYLAFESGERLYGELPWPTWIFLSFVPLGIGLLAVGLLLEAPDPNTESSDSWES